MQTSLLRSLINRPFDAGYVPTLKCNYAVNSVEIGGAEKYLVVLMVILMIAANVHHR